MTETYHHLSARRYDDRTLRRLIQYWPLIISIIGIVAGYAILGESVRTHHSIDDSRDYQQATKLAEHAIDIAALKEGTKAMAIRQEQILGTQAEIQADIKEILKRLR